MMGDMVLIFDEKGGYCRIMAGFAGLKTASSRGTMDTEIDLRVLE